MTTSPGMPITRRIGTIHAAAAISILFHLCILLMIGYCYHHERPVSADSIQVFYVTAGEEAREETRNETVRKADDHIPARSYRDAEQKLNEKPPELPSFAYPTNMPRQNAASDEPGEAPPPLPGILSQNGTEGTPIPYPTGIPRRLPENEDTAGSGKGGQNPCTPHPSGSPRGGEVGSGAQRVAATRIEGCRLFILPLGSSPLAKEKALSLCEGLTPAEERHARKMELTVALGNEGEPGDITLTRSCGDRRLDEEVQAMLPLMRFDASTAGEGPLYYLTMILVFSDEKEEKVPPLLH